MRAAVHTLSDFPPPRPAGRPFGTPAEYVRLFSTERTPSVELPSGRSARLVGRYADVRAVLTGRVSADGGNPGFPMIRRGPASTAKALSFFRMDGADHRRYRKLVTSFFTVSRVTAMRPALQDLVDELIDGVVKKGPPIDLVDELAFPIPSLVICTILGVPYRDRRHFQRLSDILARGPQRGAEDFIHAIQELRAYAGRLAAAKRNEHADDLMSALIDGFAADPSLDPEQLATIVLLLLVAGNETTANMISLGALALMGQAGPRAAMAGERSLLPNAVEELLRYVSITQWIPRVAAEDLLIGREPVRVGEGLIVLPMMANRDPDVFPAPDRLDVRRDNASSHLGFGFGPHQCLGLQLARAELQIVYSTLFRRLPNLRPAVQEHRLVFRDRAAMYGIESLPVTW